MEFTVKLTVGVAIGVLVAGFLIGAGIMKVTEDAKVLSENIQWLREDAKKNKRSTRR